MEMLLTFPIRFMLWLFAVVLLTLAAVLYVSAEPIKLTALQSCQTDLYANRKSLIEWQMRAMLAEAELSKTEGPKAMERLRQEYEAWEKQMRVELQVAPEAVFDPTTKSFSVVK